MLLKYTTKQVLTVKVQFTLINCYIKTYVKHRVLGDPTLDPYVANMGGG